MKRSINNALSELDRKSMGYIAVLSFTYGNVCVKADPTSLLNIEEEEDGNVLKIEDMAYVIVHDEEGDDDKMDLIPKCGDQDLPFISQAVIKVHPEFGQSIEVLETEGSDMNDEGSDAQTDSILTKEDMTRHFLRLTMPVVDKDRKKLLEDAANLAYDECKAKLDASGTICTGIVTAQLVGEDVRTVEFVKKVLEDSKKKYLDMAGQFKTDKLKEIEDAYQRFLTKSPQAAKGADADSLSDRWKTLKV